MANTDSELTPDQQTAMENFANLTTMMNRKAEQIVKLGLERRKIGDRLVELGITKSAMAKRAGISEQAVYKMFREKPSS